MLQGYQIGIIAGTELYLADEYGGIDIGGMHNQKPSTKDRELFVSNYALGGVLGAIFGSLFSDWVGRKWTGILGDVFIAIGFVVVILADGIFVGIIGRITSGFGQGLQNFAIPLYLNEVGTNKYNKIISAYYTLMIGGGMIFGLNLSIPFRHDWKFLYEIGLIECAVLAVFIFMLPESQVFFMNNDQDDEAKKVVLRGVEKPEDADWYMRQLKLERRFYWSKKVDYLAKCRDLFGTYGKSFGIAIILATFSQLVGTSAFLNYGPEVIKMTGSTLEDKEVDESADILDNFIIIAFVLGNLISAYLIYHVGRRWIILIAIPAAFSSAACLAYFMYEANYGDDDEPDQGI